MCRLFPVLSDEGKRSIYDAGVLDMFDEDEVSKKIMIFSVLGKRHRFLALLTIWPIGEFLGALGNYYYSGFFSKFNMKATLVYSFFKMFFL